MSTARWTERVKKIWQHAQREANGDPVATFHLLMGMLHEPSGVAGTVLRDAKIELATVAAWRPRRLIDDLDGLAVCRGTMVTSRTATVLKNARAEMADLGHSCLGTEHLLLGLLRAPKNEACSILTAIGGNSIIDELRTTVRQLIGAPPIPSKAAFSDALTETEVIGVAAAYALSCRQRGRAPVDGELARIKSWALQARAHGKLLAMVLNGQLRVDVVDGDVVFRAPQAHTGDNVCLNVTAS